MKQRGRKSTAALLTFPVVDGTRPRLTPPSSLTKAERTQFTELAAQAGLTLGDMKGIRVDETMMTSVPDIYAAGDVCQIWSDAEKRYRFFYGWKNVRAMGDLAARNIAGGDDPWVPAQDEKLHISDDGKIQSPFWEYE